MYRNHFLFVCSANLLRSPTAEHVARNLGFFADSAGTMLELATRPLTKEAIDRAEVIVCMAGEHYDPVIALAPDRGPDIDIWNIPDTYNYCELDLVKQIRDKLHPYFAKFGRMYPTRNNHG